MRKIIVVLIVACVLFLWGLNGTEKIYGNDEPSIIQVVQAMETYQQSDVKVLDVQDFDDYRVASLEIDEFSIASAFFKKNAKGNYKLETFQVNGYQDDVHIFELPIRMYQLVFKGNHEVAQLEIQVNNKKEKPVPFTPKEAAYYFIKLDEIDPDEKEWYDWKLLFFDQQEKLLNMEEGSYWLYMEEK